ncbi:MAG: efflux RND transporter periplasmic adaptor subunit [Desulfobacteraceae bacterium]|nr:efflux RND transporter periplasmic adaptor subunit [Desulfobacteraceae bacterium]
MSDERHADTPLRTRPWWIHLFWVVVLVGAGVMGLVTMTQSKPEIERKPTPVLPPLVQTVEVDAGTQTISIAGEGTVRPTREIRLTAQVGGKAVFVSDNLVNGGAVQKDELLVRIDPTDYHLAVTAATARVEDSLSRLILAEAESEAAIAEWKTLNGDDEVPDLVAKTPQLAAAKAVHKAARADLEQAGIHLSRTRILAPFDGRVAGEAVDIGQQISPGQILADIFCVASAQIVIPLADDDLLWIRVPGLTPGNRKGSEVTVSAKVAGRKTNWQGRVVRAEGKLDPLTRLVNVVVQVDRPYSRRPPLVPGAFVFARIKGKTLEDAVTVPRSAIRPNHTIWQIDEHHRLRLRQVDILRMYGDVALIGGGLKIGDRLVISPLKAVTDGMRVRTGDTATVSGTEVES